MMDPNPKKFPILSYVLEHLNSGRQPNPSNSPTAFDIEQPPLPSSFSPRYAADLVERMPRLNHPDLLASMTSAISDVAQTRSILRTLGDRPDHESVDAARTRVAEIDAELSMELEEIVRSPRSEGVDTAERMARMAEREKECRARVEKKKCVYRAVVQLDDMHEAYEKLLRDAEERLVGIYGSSTAGKEPVAAAEERGKEVFETDEEVVRVLQEASGKCLESVDLSGRQLQIIPEAFGRLGGLRVLNLSNNQLEVIPDSIAGVQHLEELCLSANTLISLPDSIGLLLNLKILDASANKLKKLPDSISHCRSLVELDVSYNELTYLPTNIGLELVNLQKLLVHLNKIRSIPTSVCEMRSLRHLDAHFNELHGLPYAIGKLTNLEILDLSSNFSDLTELPITFGNLTNLRELDLSNNQIHALPDTFGQLENLVKLNLDQNPIVIPPVDVVNEGVEGVKEFMVKRLLDILLEEERKSTLEAETESRNSWLTQSTSWLSNRVSGVFESVSGYIGAGQKRDPYLDQQL